MAYKNDRHFSYYPSSSFRQQIGLETRDFHELIDQALYESDDFRMYAYKIKVCPKVRSHDWTSCPYTHRGEKARRRDPRRYNYLPIPCPSYKFGECIKEDDCELSHGVFEYWLHPAKYRTHPCNAGTLCNRRVCFFAHTLREMRPETKYNWCYVYQYPLHVQPYPDVLFEDGQNGWILIPSNPQQAQYYGTVPGHVNSSTYNNHELLNIPSTTTTQPQQTPLPEEMLGVSSTYYDLSNIPSTSHSQQTEGTCYGASGPQVQNQSDFSFFSASHARLTEELKNLEIGSSLGRVNNMQAESSSHDDRGKRPVEHWEFQDPEFPHINWVSDLLVDES